MDGQELDEYKRNARHKSSLTAILVVLTISMSIYSICVSKYHIGFSEAWDIVLNNLRNIPASTYYEELKYYIVWDGFVPRAISGVLVGAILAIGGAIMQTIIKNPLTDSYTTGISSGALFGVTIFIILGISIVPGLTGDLGMMVNAFVFSLIPSGVIIFFSVFRKITPTAMVLIGVAVMYMFNATTTLLKYTCSEEDLSEIYAWSIGTLGKTDWNSVPYLLGAFILISLMSVLTYKSINILSTSDESSISMGVNPYFTRTICLLTISTSTAIAVCFTGTIGFVGLVAPHIARILVGSNVRQLIPSSAIIGAFMLISADCVARILGSTGLPVGVVTALIGGPVFLSVLLMHKKQIF